MYARIDFFANDAMAKYIDWLFEDILAEAEIKDSE